MWRVLPELLPTPSTLSDLVRTPPVKHVLQEGPFVLNLHSLTPLVAGLRPSNWIFRLRNSHPSLPVRSPSSWILGVPFAVTFHVVEKAIQQLALLARTTPCKVAVKQRQALSLKGRDKSGVPRIQGIAFFSAIPKKSVC